MINCLLPAPILKKNPRYRSAAPMKLWPEDLIASIEASPAFAAEVEKAAPRRRAARKAADTKIRATRQEAQELLKSVTIRRLPYHKLKTLAIRVRQEWYNDLSTYRGAEYRTAADADEQTVHRWMVNYARHNLTEYDNKLEDFRGRAGTYLAHEDIKGAILDMIAAAYPMLADECKRQQELTIITDKEEPCFTLFFVKKGASARRRLPKP